MCANLNNKTVVRCTPLFKNTWYNVQVMQKDKKVMNNALKIFSIMEQCGLTFQIIVM